MTRKVCCHCCWCCCYCCCRCRRYRYRCCFYYNDVVENDRRREKKGLDEMPVKWRESSPGKGSRSCPASRSATIVTTRTDVPEQGAGVPRTLLLSGVLHNSSSVFLRCCNPSSYGDPLGSFSPPSNGEAAATPSRHNGTHQASRINYARPCPPEK